MLKIDTEWSETDLWAGKYLLYKSDVWPDRHICDFLIFVGYAQVKKLPFRLDLFYILKSEGSGKVAEESGSGNLFSHTIGLQADGKAFDVLDAEATFAVQRGRYAGDKIRALGASGKLGITIPVVWKPRLGGQFTWGSGDTNPADRVHGTFDGVYGGRDIFFYEYLNLFFWANLRDAKIDLNFSPSRTLTTYFEYHHFRLDQPRDAWYTTGLIAYRRDPTGLTGTALGDEVDFRVALTPWKHLELMAGAGRFFAGNFVNNTGPAGTALWFFVQSGYSW